MGRVRYIFPIHEWLIFYGKLVYIYIRIFILKVNIPVLWMLWDFFFEMERAMFGLLGWKPRGCEVEKSCGEEHVQVEQ